MGEEKEEQRGELELRDLEMEKRRALEAVFGVCSDEDEDSRFLPTSPFSGAFHRHEKVDWERVEGIKGLWLCRDFLSPDRQATLLSDIEKERWFCEKTHNQAMRFGDLPIWTIELSTLVQEAACLDDSDIGMFAESETEDHDNAIFPLPGHLLWRDPLFDQLIVNVYEPGEGICAHVDLMRFEDGIAIISLQSECVMHFTLVEQHVPSMKVGEGKIESSTRIPVLLTPGSLVIMSGDARYRWNHEINRKPGFQVWDGKDLVQSKRTSITLRKICPSS